MAIVMDILSDIDKDLFIAQPCLGQDGSMRFQRGRGYMWLLLGLVHTVRQFPITKE